MIKRPFTAITTILSMGFILVGCGLATPADIPAPVVHTTDSAPLTPTRAHPASEVEPSQPAGVVPTRDVVEIPKLNNPLSDGEYRWNQLLARDAIFPVYDPTFAAATDAPYDDDELVIGVEINGQAKAYAIGPLNGREMVNDELGGIPILVTW